MEHRRQLSQLDTVGVAYVPPGAGALYSGKGPKKNKLHDRFLTARQELLASTKRMLVDLRQVSDPEYRDELKAAGVKASPVKASLHGSPGIGDGAHLLRPDIRPKRALPQPKVVLDATFAASVELKRRSRRPPRTLGEPVAEPRSRGTVALGIGAASLALAPRPSWPTTPPCAPLLKSHDHTGAPSPGGLLSKNSPNAVVVPLRRSPHRSPPEHQSFTGTWPGAARYLL